MEQLEMLYQRLKRFEQDNAANPHPVQTDFRRMWAFAHPKTWRSLLKGIYYLHPIAQLSCG
jgi:hypothetical protein